MGILNPAIAAIMASAQFHHGNTFHMPAETEHQAGVIMAWPTEYSILNESFAYPGSRVDQTRRELAEVAKAIAKYEPLEMFVRDPKAGEPGGRNEDTNLKSAQELLGDVENVTLHVTQNVHSLWARDTGPVFVRSMNEAIKNTWGKTDNPGIGFDKTNTSSEVVGLLMNYNNWGRKNIPNTDSYFAGYAAQELNRSSRIAPFVAEGGGIEVDGEGTLIATESAILNPNRNPGVDKETMERYFAEVLGIEKTIWLPGSRGTDITDDHIDALARFTVPGTVVISKSFAPDGDDSYLDDFNSAKSILSKATDAKGRKLKLVELPEPDPAEVLADNYQPDSGPCVSYVNYLVVNGAVICAKFGDEEKDAEAKRIIQELYPGRVVEQVYLHEIAMQGGGIHCATQQVPA